jgi:hypothetical protein
MRQMPAKASDSVPNDYSSVKNILWSAAADEWFSVLSGTSKEYLSFMAGPAVMVIVVRKEWPVLHCCAAGLGRSGDGLPVFSFALSAGRKGRWLLSGLIGVQEVC